MPQHTLYAYVDGGDFAEIADALEARFAQFVDGRPWVSGRASIVNQRHDEISAEPGESPDWDLGVNLDLPDPGAEFPGWFTDVEAIAQFLGELHREFGRDFVIGLVDTQTGITEDLFDVSTDSPDLGKLRAIIGVGYIA